MTREHASDADVARAREMAETLIEHHLGSKPSRAEELAGGLTNFVFEVDHPDGEFIVRLSFEPSKIKDFLKEQWSIARAREVGVPVPEVLEVGADVVETPFMIARKVPGEAATDHHDRMDTLRELGRYAALIHSIPTRSFGRTFDWSSNQLSRQETWKEFLHEELGMDKRLDFLEEHEILGKRQLKHLRETFEDIENFDHKPVLNHGDLRLKNVMVDEHGAIQAVIDWENCTSNIAPYWDLSVALHDLSIDAKQEFLVGYGMSEEDIREAAPFIKALNVLNYVPYVEGLVKKNDTIALDRYRTRLTGALDLYSL